MTVEFDLTADERALQDAIVPALQDASPVQALTRGTQDAVAIARRHWALAVETGWPGLLVPEHAGGAGMGMRELAVLCEAMGQHLFCGPFVATGVLGATIAALAEPHGRMPGLPAAIASGEAILAVAAVPPSGVWIAAEPSLTLGASALSGVREVVEHPALATHFLAIDAAQRRDSGVDLVAALIPADRGIIVEPRQSFDVSCPVATVRFERSVVEAGDILRVTLSCDEFASLMHPTHLALAAELTGVAQAALDGAANYARTREQFGKPIGSFQAIKHKLADGFIAVSNARLAVRHAASVEDPAAADATRVLAADAAFKTTADYIQIQGGMGISWESEAHLYLKRARRLAAAYGDTRQFQRALVDRFVASVLAEGGAGKTARDRCGSNNAA